MPGDPRTDVGPEFPAWLPGLLGLAPPPWTGQLEVHGARYEARAGVLRSAASVSATQEDTASAFAYKWSQRSSFESEASRARARAWLLERYGDVAAQPWWRALPAGALLVDAGCGAGLSALELFGEALRPHCYLGVEISAAVDLARSRFRARGLDGAFVQGDLCARPLPPAAADVILAEGVLHHTDSTRGALRALVPFLKPGGRLLFYVYRRKGPIREFTDDYVRARVQSMSGEEAWAALLPLTRLGVALGELGARIEVPEAIGLLDIPAGSHDLQRLFYWHVAKAFYRPDLTIEEMNHINFDWYAPANAHRQSPEEVRTWCEEAALEIEREVVEDAGVTIIARRA